MRGKMDYYGMTDAGKVRAANEDQFLIASLHKSLLIHQTSLSHDDHTRLFGGTEGTQRLAHRHANVLAHVATPVLERRKRDGWLAAREQASHVGAHEQIIGAFSR